MKGRWATPTLFGAAVILVLLLGVGLSRISNRQTAPVNTVAVADGDAVAIDRLVMEDRVARISLADPSGMVVVPGQGSLYVSGASGAVDVADFGGRPDHLSVELDGEAIEALAIDPETRELVVVRAGGTSVEWYQPTAEQATKQLSASASIAFGDGIAFERRRNLIHGLSRGVLSTYSYGPEGDVGPLQRRIDVSALAAGGALQGLSVDEASGLLYVGSLARAEIHEFDRSGELVRTLDVSRASVLPSAFAVGASTDPSDSSGTTSMFVAGSIPGSPNEAGVVELAPAVVPAFGAEVVDRADLVQAIPLDDLPWPAPDSSAITWLPDEGRLLVADSEVDEYDFFDGVSIWTVELDGTVQPRDLGGAFPSAEPTGMAVDQAGNLYITDDVARRVHVMTLESPGAGQTNPPETSGWSTEAFGSLDPEDVAFDSRRNRLYIVDGGAKEVFILEPGPNGVFEGGGDDTVESFDVAVHGLSDPEGIAYDSRHDTFVVVDRADTLAVEFGPDGGVLRQIDLSAAQPTHLAGVTWAPGSGGGIALWTVDRGIDGPLVVDGRVYEMAVPPLAGGMTAPSIGVPSSVVDRSSATSGPSRLSVEIANRGTAALQLTDVRLHGVDPGSIVVLRDSVPEEITAGSSREVVLDIARGSVLPSGARLIVDSSDPNRPRVVIPIIVGT